MELSVVLSLPVLTRVLAWPWGRPLEASPWPLPALVWFSSSCPNSHFSCPSLSDPLPHLPRDTDP